MALYIPQSILHLARSLYVRPETYGPTYVCRMFLSAFTVCSIYLKCMWKLCCIEICLKMMQISDIHIKIKITAVMCVLLDENLTTVYLEIWSHLNDFFTLWHAVEVGNMSLKASCSNFSFRPCKSIYCLFSLFP